jgi:hypothetical protein
MAKKNDAANAAQGAKQSQTAVAVSTTKTLATTETTAIAEVLAQDVGGGFENVTAADMAVPFITLLQALSPQLRGATAVHGAREGLLYNTVTGDIYESINVLPCAFNRAWVEWVERSKGGGFVAHHATDELMATTKRNDKNMDILPNGNVLVQTAYHYCLLINKDGSTSRVVISMTRTQLKKSRKWISRMTDLKLPIGPNKTMATPASYSHVYNISAEMEERNGNTFQNYKISDPIPVTKPELYLAGRAFCAEVNKGLVKVTPPSDTFEDAAPPVTDDNHF